MKTAVKIFIIIILAVPYSCAKDVDSAKLPEFKRKLVISGFLSPDEKTHYISVGFTQILYVGSDESSNHSKTTGMLSDGEKEISLRPIFRKYNSIFSLDSAFAGFVFTSEELPVIEGKTYTLKVDTEDGLHAESSCIVPCIKNFLPTFDTTRIWFQSNPEYSFLQTEFSFTDIAGEDNYYTLLCEHIFYLPYNKPPRPEIRTLLDKEKSYFSDKGFEGKRMKILLNNFRTPGNNIDSAFLKIYFLNTDKPYYDFHKSILKYNSGEIPFTEASPIYSNIKGGLGIFAAYTCDSIVLRLK